MMILERPYFMNNPEWFYFDESAWMYKLTPKATPEAVKSYKEHYRQLNIAKEQTIRKPQ